MLILRYNIIDPSKPGVEQVQYPINVNWLKDIALRDLALHERHAACVDAKGDMYQWDDRFFGLKPKSESEAQELKLPLCGKLRQVTFREGIITQSACIG